MKKFLLIAALFAGSVSLASAQSTIVKVNILSPMVKTGSFFVEHAVGEHSSLQLGALYTRWGTNGNGLSGFALTPEYRMYLSNSESALQGFYLAPYLRYQNLTLTDNYEWTDSNGNTRQDQAQAALNTLGGGVVAGYQVLVKRRFSFDAFIGPSYNNGTIRVRDTGSSSNATFDAGLFTGYGIRSGVTFGIAF